MRNLLLAASLLEVFVLSSPLPQFGNRGISQMIEKSTPQAANFMASSQALNEGVADQSQAMSNTANRDFTNAFTAWVQAVDQAALSAHDTSSGMLIDAENLFCVNLISKMV
jgi:hypothetical protein